MNLDRLPQHVRESELRCSNCGASFGGTLSQKKHSYYEGRPAYCSEACVVASRDSRRKPIPNRGPCPQCGAMFESRTEKKYCSLRCYTQSDQFRKMVADNAPIGLARAREVLGRKDPVYLSEPCAECGKVMRFTSGRRRRFCSKAHYRSYLAKRFDRWVASPQRIGMPANYDEFLSLDELPCLIPGCGWIGRGLSNHANLAHGIRASAFKRAAGFNLGTGIVAAPTHELLVERNADGKYSDFMELARAASGCNPPTGPRGYISQEGREHASKTRALIGPGPLRSCRACGEKFQQTTPMGRTLYCSIECRTRHYGAQIKAAPRVGMCCGLCGQSFMGTKDQKGRSDAGLTVFCSTHCRQINNAKAAVAVRRARAAAVRTKH